jgi:DNA-binding NarL/FixJ family response regulator
MVIRVLIVDDHSVVREGLRMFLARDPDLRIVGEAADGVEAIEQARLLRPDVVVMD